MVAASPRPLSGTSPRHLDSASSITSARIFGRRRVSKLRFRVMMLLYFAVGCIIPYYVMKLAEEEELYRQLESSNQSPVFDINNPKGYKRRAFFRDLNGNDLSEEQQQQQQLQQLYQRPRYDRVIRIPYAQATTEGTDSLPAPLHHLIQKKQQHHSEILGGLSELFLLHRQTAKLFKVTSPQSYYNMMKRVVQEARKGALKRIPVDHHYLDNAIPGTRLNTQEKTRRFRQLMDQALDKGRWVYESDRDYPDFGGAIGWNKKMKNERDRDVAINRPPFPEAGKYHWEPVVNQEESVGSSNEEAMGWSAKRIQPHDFCRILGPRHIVLVGDIIHWQLHDSIMYNMFDSPQTCYGDLACHLGVGHPICPLPNDVRLKFVRNDLLSPIRPRQGSLNETKSQDPVEMSWIRDMKLKDTIILGATHQSMDDRTFRKLLLGTLIKIRKVRPDALIIYRNNPVGHPDCPSKSNGFNMDKPQQENQTNLNESAKSKLFHNNSTFSARAEPFDQDIPIAEMLDYPLNWVHYDRQNRIAKEIVELIGGIYWNVATMTNMRPDGHVGGQDCLGYKRPGPTDEWAISLYNIFRTIELVENE
ncbi:hypothetical protein BGZ76_009524 [Entomortierella beljakovae]|nr:hypothetical protein BGZ76_009524 [Entomortierella beljakovae]